ncbi:hypothetical protein C8R43DRAFT_1154982 [Mycena crocata]|nr:hypothetical protein C8R43DRAFT_1154982 [Mycena crocata]
MPPKGIASDSEPDIWDGSQTVWHAWDPECDSCGRVGSALKKAAKDRQLFSCAACLVAKYCSKECQRRAWSQGHKNECHLFEANRKLLSVFAKSLGAGTINDQKLNLAEKLVECNFLNLANLFAIAASSVKNDPKLAGTVNVAVLITVADDRAGSNYENRTFFIDRVRLLARGASNAFARKTKWVRGSIPNSQECAQRTDTDHFKLMVGWCLLPGDILPPGFDLNRYIAHVNRGITHFHASCWPLPRTISDLDVESAEMPAGWNEYVKRQRDLLSHLKGGQNFVARLKALVDPSRMVRLLSQQLEALEQDQSSKLERTNDFHPGLTLEQAMKLIAMRLKTVEERRVLK